VLIDFGVVSADDFTSGRLKGASRTELSYLLYEFLATLGPLEAFAVVVIDEAQNLSLSLLEEIRILSDSDAVSASCRSCWLDRSSCGTSCGCQSCGRSINVCQYAVISDRWIRRESPDMSPTV